MYTNVIIEVTDETGTYIRSPSADVIFAALQYMNDVTITIYVAGNVIDQFSDVNMIYTYLP